ncbi:hypothetical protein DVH24_006124 [Malus domestica]|uniref:Uncharacterized protein n=1 Tax=Malus domestica TaxID=3750 RepID=A0A498J1L9_MALDO|nr:hypothetical protein DVH24_006124 [Malus domestica]
MAQDYVGSNNVNLFIPDAQFGTQIPEAKTMLVLIIYTLGFLLYQDSFFPRMMIYVLEHLSAYGKRVEPKRFCLDDLHKDFLLSLLDEGPTPLDQLVAYKWLSKLKIWKPKYPGMGDKYTALHCILVDEKQQAIEASSDEMDYEIIVPKIEVGCYYEIMNFRTNKTRAQYRVVLHDTHIMLTSKIVFKKLTSVFLPIPWHEFFLQDYNRLYPRLKKLDILIVIQNIRNKEAKITLLSDVAHSFSALSSEQLPKQIIVIFTSFRVKLFAELNLCKLVFSNWPHSITLPPSKQANEQEILQTREKVTIEELGYLDPDLYKNDTFLCQASIKQYNTRYKVFLVLEDETNDINALIIGKSGENVFGMPCKDLVFNQRLADQKPLPSEFFRLIGQRKKFHLQFGSRRNLLISNDFPIYNVSKDLTIQPATP